MMPAKLAGNSYGKYDVRLTKIIRNGSRHDLLEFSVDIQLGGDFARSFTHGDNRSIIATDSMKNTVYVLAKEKTFSCAEEFSILLAEHFLSTYTQVDYATVEVHQTHWDRMQIDGKPHDHAFTSGRRDLCTAGVMATKKDGLRLVSGGIRDLLLLKTTQSAFKDFVSDRYRTLKDADDRIFATLLTAKWSYASPQVDFRSVRKRIESAMLNVFATRMSHAVQETLFQMGQAALAEAPEIDQIHLEMPNKHRIPVNLQPFGLENNNEIFVWTDEPFGNIFASVEREKTSP